jgi:ABC-type multidrug transport system fused ATPase/permease subunit
VASLNLLFSSYKGFSKNSPNFIKNKSTDINLLDNKKSFSYKNFLSIKDIFFKYPNTKNFVFKKFNLNINFGEFIGISGVSGSGKSTLINLILGLLKPNFGLITYCGNNIHNNIKSWHSKIGYIPQDIFLIDDTIKNNIAFGLNNKDIDDEKIFSLLKKLKIFNPNGNLKKLINFNVGEFGKKLSGGQKQRIAIARALYRDPEILIFDEATSALDSKTEKKIMNLIYSLRKEKTIIFISHKLNTLKYCDKIIKVNKTN